MGQVPLQGGSGHPEDFGGLSGAEPLHSGEFKPRQDPAGSAQGPPLPLGPLEACQDAFSDAAPFKFRQSSQYMELQSPG